MIKDLTPENEGVGNEEKDEILTVLDFEYIRCHIFVSGNIMCYVFRNCNRYSMIICLCVYRVYSLTHFTKAGFIKEKIENWSINSLVVHESKMPFPLITWSCLHIISIFFLHLYVLPIFIYANLHTLFTFLNALIVHVSWICTTTREISHLSKCPPLMDICEELKSNTGFVNFINTEILFSLVLELDDVLKITAGLWESED